MCARGDAVVTQGSFGGSGSSVPCGSPRNICVESISWHRLFAGMTQAGGSCYGCPLNPNLNGNGLHAIEDTCTSNFATALEKTHSLRQFLRTSKKHRTAKDDPAKLNNPPVQSSTCSAGDETQRKLQASSRLSFLKAGGRKG